MEQEDNDVSPATASLVFGETDGTPKETILPAADGAEAAMSAADGQDAYTAAIMTCRTADLDDPRAATARLMYNYKTARGRAFLKDNRAARDTLPQLLPKGLPFAANYISFQELKERGVLSVSKKDEVSITTDEVRLLYQAKCVDQVLAPSWEREVRFMELISAKCKGAFFLLPENGLGPASADAVKHVLSRNKRYSVLDLSGNRLCDEGAAAIAELVKANRTIAHLGLSSNDIGHEGAAAIAKALEVNNTVISLDIGAKFGMNGNHIGTKGAQGIADVLKVNRVLWRLCLGSNGLGPKGVARIAEGLAENHVLTRLDLSGNNLGPDGAAVVKQILERGVIKWISLQRNSLGDKGGRTIFEAIIGDAEAGVSGSLEYLDVENNELGPLSARAIGKALSSSGSLHTLCLSGNNFRPSGTNSVVKFIADGVGENKSLRSLSLSNCGLREGDGAAFGTCLALNHVLAALDLSKNALKDRGAKEIAKGLGVNKGLTSVNLSSNKIGDPGGRDLASSLSHNSTLREVSLRRNAMSGSTGEYYSEVLRGNTTVEKLDVSYNDFSYKSSMAIQAILERNGRQNKQLIIPRLTQEIESLAPKERELGQVEEEIDMEKRIIKDRSEQILRRNEEARVILEKMRRDAMELEKSVDRVRLSCEEAEDLFRKTEDRVTNETTSLKAKKTSLEARIQQEKDRVDRLHREMDKMKRQIEQIQEAENQRFAPLLNEIRQTEQDRDREKKDAQFEAEKLTSLALKKKELEIAMAASGKKKKK